MNPNETPTASLTVKPLALMTDDELDALYQRLCPQAADLATVEVKPKKTRKKPEMEVYE